MHFRMIVKPSVPIILTFVFILLFSQGAALSEDLSSNIMRRVNAANEYLDKAEEAIKGGRAEHAPGILKSARQEYDNIFNYYKGSFDPDHPTLTSLKERMDGIEAQLSAPVETTEVKEVSPAKGDAELSANIRRRIDAADRHLVWVNKAAAKGTDDPGELNAAKMEYNSIFEYYKGSFDPEHPDLVALKNRIDAAEKAAKDGVAETNQSAPLESNRRAVEDLPSQMGEDLVGVALSLRTLENRLETAGSSQQPGSYVPGVKSDLEIVEEKFSKFNSTYHGGIPAEHSAYLQVQTRLQNDREAVANLDQQAQTEMSAQQGAATAAFAADVERIHGKFNQLEPTSTLHGNNPGRMVWSTRQINMSDQDNITLQNTFKLTDPIFGRLYLHYSLGNTPVYSQSGGAKPETNDIFGYEFRLFIDGQEKVHKFDLFDSGNMAGAAGETWTTWQFAPSPVPYDETFSQEAEAWRKTTQGLSAGTHTVRFELWGTQGSYRTMEAISVGEFSLVVGQGDRVTSGLKFPEDSFSGSGKNDIREAMKRAMVGAVAKSSDEIIKVAVTSDWKTGVYSDSKRKYRTISGAILWYDKDDDGYCRFTTYNFVSDHSGGDNWGTLKFKSFCIGCPEGDVERP